MHKKLVNIACVVPEISSRTDRHRHTPTYSSQYFRNRYRGEIITLATIDANDFTCCYGRSVKVEIFNDYSVALAIFITDFIRWLNMPP